MSLNLNHTKSLYSNCANSDHSQNNLESLSNIKLLHSCKNMQKKTFQLTSKLNEVEENEDSDNDVN